jgi:CRISPR-associated endonuclease/helicase Cas3
MQRLHPLAAHLSKVAALAAQFAQPIGADFAYLAGLWHDLGKYRKAFQEGRLGLKNGAIPAADCHIESKTRVSHSHAGALYAIEQLGPQLGRILAYVIAGHHSGLPDYAIIAQGNSSTPIEPTLKFRLGTERAAKEFAESLCEAIPQNILATPKPPQVPAAARDVGFALWVRMLFSCLVDADFLDTESFFNATKSANRQQPAMLTQFLPLLNRHLEGMANADTLVNRERADVLAACRSAAAHAPGFFTLTVPTGGGKTLSSMAFALEHARHHGKQRVIFAIPYTSIIEQTAEVFRAVFAELGADAVLEHHSSLDVAEKDENHLSRLAAENWDAPLIVTTNVQLFESLHAARTSRCRKLHNLCNSVIVLDEAQLLPAQFLAPVIRALQLLVKHYGVTVVLCTATQPNLRSRTKPVTHKPSFTGIDNAHEIVGDQTRLNALFANLSRVHYLGLDTLTVQRSWDDIAQALSSEAAVLAIVNTRGDALQLHKKVSELSADGDGDVVHLSALMCAQHRSAVISQIKTQLTAQRSAIALGQPVRHLRVISTQLVEAGVDLDFPVVYRAISGLDSIAQAAGRCNREGKLAGKGKVVVFAPPQFSNHIKDAIYATQHVCEQLLKPGELLPQDFERYFDRYYGTVPSLDAQKINDLLTPDREQLSMAFRSASEKFKLIDEDSEAVVVPYVPVGKSKSPVHDIVGKLKQEPNNRGLLRQLQRYTISIRRKAFEKLAAQGDIVQTGIVWVASDVRYDARVGLMDSNDHGTNLMY